LKTLNTTFFTVVSFCFKKSVVDAIAISAAFSFGKWKTPVEMQQKATLSKW